MKKCKKKNPSFSGFSFTKNANFHFEHEGAKFDHRRDTHFKDLRILTCQR